MANKYMRIFSTSLAIREMQMKTAMRYHYTPIRMAKIQNTDNTKCWQGCGTTGRRFPICCWWEMQNKHFARQFGSFLQN